MTLVPKICLVETGGDYTFHFLANFTQSTLRKTKAVLLEFMWHLHRQRTFSVQYSIL